MVIKVNQVANENHVKFYVNLTTPLHAHFMCILFECSFSILNFTTPIHGLVVVVATYKHLRVLPWPFVGNPRNHVCLVNFAFILHFFISSSSLVGLYSWFWLFWLS